MRSRQRLTGLKNWITKELCKGREYKAPSADYEIAKTTYQEPKCFLGWSPSMPGNPDYNGDDPMNVCPCILVMPCPSKAKGSQEQRFDRYNNVHRPKAYGQTLSVQLLFMIYEPGIMLPGAVDESREVDFSKVAEGTEQGLFTLYDWMDDAIEKLLAAKSIPDTDLMLDEENLDYSPYTDQSFIVDKRPLYYGIVTAEFKCYADEGVNSEVENFLK